MPNLSFNITELQNITFGMNIADKYNPSCFCIYPVYDMLFLVNITLMLFYLLINMFNIVERKSLKDLGISTKEANIIIFMSLFALNIYFFLIHFLGEKLAYFLAYL